MIPLNQPSFTEKEAAYVAEALASGWVTTGKFVERLEEGFCKLTGRRYAVACSSGTAAVWLALVALGVKAGHRVVCQDYTCDAPANAIHNVTGFPPITIDVEPATWAMSARRLKVVLDDRLGRWGGATTPFPVAAVTFNHSYGVPARDSEEIETLCRRAGVPLIEDASEAHGASLNGRPAGSFGEVSVFSCRGEKTVGGGQLGVLVTDDERVARKAKQWSHNGLPVSTVRYWSTVPGLNFQPSNMNAALACAQLERLDELVKLRNAVHDRWYDLLRPWIGQGLGFQAPCGHPAWWLTGIVLGREFTTMLPQDLGAALAERGIATRPGFYPVSWLPHAFGCNEGTTPVSQMLLERLLILPSGPTITAAQQERVVAEMLDIVGKA